MEKRAGRARNQLERLRQSQTATIRSLDRLTGRHIDEMAARQLKIAALARKIEELEAETK